MNKCKDKNIYEDTNTKDYRELGLTPIYFIATDNHCEMHTIMIYDSILV